MTLMQSETDLFDKHADKTREGAQLTILRYKNRNVPVTFPLSYKKRYV